MDGVRGRTPVVFVTKNMRELQPEYCLIIELVHQLKEVNKRFVWMAAIEDHFQYDCVGIFLRLEEETFLKVLGVNRTS